MKYLTLACLACMAAGTHAQLIVGNDQSGTATIYSINVTTGVATALYSAADNTAKPWGMAADNVNNILYWNNGSTLYSATLASLASGTPTINSIVMPQNYVGLGFNPNTGKLLGTRNIATEAVYEIDPLTGAHTQLFAYSSTLDFGGVDYDGGKLYGLSDSGARGLHEIDYANSTTNLIVGYPGAETDIDGLAVGGGKAYFVTDGPNTTQASFYVYNLGTNQFEAPLMSTFTGSGTFSAATWAPGIVPEPATMTALALGLAAIAARRRRR